MNNQPATPPGLLKTDSFTKQPLEPQNVMKSDMSDYGPNGKRCCCCDVDPLCEFCCGMEFYHKCCGGYPV